MPEMRRGIAGMITAVSFVGMGLLIYAASDPSATFLGAITGFVFIFSIFAVLFKDSFIGGVATVVALIGFAALLWRSPSSGFVLGSGILGGVCAVIASVLTR